MKRMISLLAAVMLISSCGTAPRADLLSESRVTSGLDEEQGESEMAHYLIGGAVVVVALCTVVPGARRACQKQFISAKKFKSGLQDKITKLGNEMDADGADTAKLQSKIDKLEDIKGKADKDGIFFTAYDKTIGSLVRKIRKTDASDEAGENADEQSAKSEGGGASEQSAKSEGGEASEQSAKSEGGEAKAADEAGENADAGKQAKSEGDEAKASSDTDDASKQSTNQQK